MSRSDGIFYKTDEEVEFIRTNCLMVSKTLALVGELIRPGVNGLDIDAKAEQLIRDNGGVPGFKGYRGFPSTLCISCLLYTSPSPRDATLSRMPSSA